MNYQKMISLLHPSRSRPDKAKKTIDNWLSKASGTIPIEHLLSIDSNDPHLQIYQDIHFSDTTTKITGGNKNLVEATNQAAKISTGDILVYLSDDFNCPQDWDKLILKEFEDRPMLIKVDDGLQPFHVTVLTIPIMNRKLYEMLGYFWHPEYFSMHVDVDLYFTVKKFMKLCPHLIFQHEHPAGGFCASDETYKRSELNWNQGLSVLNKRKALNFPI